MGRYLNFAFAFLSAVAGYAQVPPELPPTPRPAEVFVAPAVTDSIEQRRDHSTATTGAHLGPVSTLLTSSGANGELWLDVPPSPYSGGILLKALATTPSVFTQLGASTSSASFAVNNASAQALFKILGDGTLLLGPGSPYFMRVNPNGYVALQSYGTGNYNARLFVQHGVDNSTALFTTHQATFEPGSPAQTDTGLFVQAHENVQASASNTGAVIGSYVTAYATGPGTLSAAIAGLLEVGTSGANTTGANLSSMIGLDVRPTRAAGTTIGTAYGVLVRDVPANYDYAFYQSGTDDTNYFAGDMIVGTAGNTNTALTVNGNATFSGTVTGGNIQAKYQDVAEWVDANTDLEPGTVVVLNPVRDNEVMASSRAYDTTVAGVVSERPGLILGEAADTKETIATTGRVRVRVNAASGPINIGDLLVTSDRPGVAMKSIPMTVNGRPLHQPGTILGKALQPLPSGEGEILVLLSLQ